MKYILIVFASIKTGEINYQHGELFDTPLQCITYVNNVYRHIDHKFFDDKDIGLKYIAKINSRRSYLFLGQRLFATTV